MTDQPSSWKENVGAWYQLPLFALVILLVAAVTVIVLSWVIILLDEANWFLDNDEPAIEDVVKVQSNCVPLRAPDGVLLQLSCDSDTVSGFVAGARPVAGLEYKLAREVFSNGIAEFLALSPQRAVVCDLYTGPESRASFANCERGDTSLAQFLVLTGQGQPDPPSLNSEIFDDTKREAISIAHDRADSARVGLHADLDVARTDTLVIVQSWLATLTLVAGASAYLFRLRRRAVAFADENSVLLEQAWDAFKKYRSDAGTHDTVLTLLDSLAEALPANKTGANARQEIEAIKRRMQSNATAREAGGAPDFKGIEKGFRSLNKSLARKRLVRRDVL
ncbi:MAG: hypothetical protein QNI99_18255 [Woeseiaceae bacterium]|nr:hypothetical protein [Woeseiaceae bacterium]